MELHHTVVVDDEHGAGRLIAAGEALQLLAQHIAADLTLRTVRDEARYILTRRDGDLELQLIAGHLYDTRESLSLSVELWRDDRLLASCGSAAGIERIKLGDGVAWLRLPGGPAIVLGDGPGGLFEVQA